MKTSRPPKVPAHTNAIGYHDQTVSTAWDREVLVSGSHFAVNATLTSDLSYKSPTITGGFSTVAKGFRTATPYSRLVMRLTSVENAINYLAGYGSIPDWQYRGDDSRHTNGVYFRSPPEIDWRSGTVDVSSHIVNRSITEARNNILGTKVELGVELAQALQTYRTVSVVFAQLVRAYLAARRGDYRALHRVFERVYEDLLLGHLLASRLISRRSSLRKVAAMLPTLGPKRLPRGLDPASLWLQYQYAWKPLVGTVVSGVQLLNEGFKSGSYLVSAQRTITEAIDPLWFFYPLERVMMVNASEAYQSARTVIWAVVRPDASQQVAYERLGLSNPLSLAWELVPYSFVLDWLVPLGAYLSSLSSTLGLDFVDSRTDKVIRVDAVAKNVRPGPGNFQTGTFAQSRVNLLAFQRVVSDILPWPRLYWVNPFTSTHVTNAVALLTNFTGRR